MALADRKYMQDPYNPPRLANKLILILIVCFVIQSILLFYGDFNVSEHLALS